MNEDDKLFNLIFYTGLALGIVFFIVVIAAIIVNIYLALKNWG